MQTAHDILERNRIECVDPNKQGRQYTTCPKCSAERSGFNRKARCLAVNINDRGVQWFCNHCETMRGGEYFEDRRKPSGAPKDGYRPAHGGTAARAMPKPPTNGYDALHRRARSQWSGRR